MIDKIKKWFTASFRTSKVVPEGLRDAESSYKMFFEGSPLPQAITSRQGVFIDVNQAFCKLHEIDRIKLIGKSVVDVGFSTAEELHLILETFNNHHKRLDGLHLKYKTHNGDPLYVRLFAHSISTKGDATILMVLDDITQQRLAEIAVMESRQFLQIVIDSIPTRVIWKDRHSVFMGCNQIAANDVGFQSPIEVVGKSDFDFFKKDLAEHFIKDDQNVMDNNEKRLFYEEQQPNPDGSSTWRLISKVPLKDVAGNVIGVLGTYDDITVRKQAEADLKLARFSINHAISPVIWISKSGRIVDFNPALNFMLQYSRNELLELSIPAIDILYSEERWPIHWEDLRQNKALTFLTKVSRKDGQELNWQVRAHFLEFEGQEYNCAFINDVTEQKKTEERLLTTHRFQQTVLNTIPSGVFWKDRQSKYLGGNAIFRTLTNYKTEEEFLGKTDYEFPWAEEADQLRADDRHVMENNISKINYVEQLHDAEGKIHFNEVSKVPLIDETGEVVGVLGTFRDITEQREIQQALKESEKLLKSVVQNASAVIFILDNQGIFQLSEGLGLAVLGLKPGQVIGVSVFEMYKDFPEVLHSIRRALAGENLENESSIGDLTFSSRYTSMRNERGEITGILGVSFDITPQKKMEEELNKLNIELEHRVHVRTEQLQQANQDLEAFAYSVSHDLRAPIRHIDGFSKLMYKAVPDPSETITRHYHRIIDSSRRMAHMVDDLLSFSRLGKKPITKNLVNLDGVLEGIIQNYKIDIAGRNVQWRINPLGKVQGDSNLLQLAFENLLSNALKYTSVCSEAIIEIGSNSTDNKLEIYIKDNGVGFDMAYADKLFGVFQRLHSHEEFEGTGIGLANVRQIVLKHNGSIRAEGKVNEGAVFYITFPLT